jgi:hypothetical protein
MVRWIQEERRVWGVQGGFVMERRMMERLAHGKDLHHQQLFLAASVPHHQGIKLRISAEILFIV